MSIIEPTYGSATVVFALDVLRVICERDEAGVTELAGALQTNKSKVIRVLRSLSLRGFVVQDKENRKYRMGPAVIALAESYRKSARVENMARRYLERLRDHFGGTGILRILDGDSVVTIASEETSSDLKVTHRVGSRFPLARGAHGKVLAAFMPDENVRSILRSQGIKKYTAKTIVGVEKFLKHLKEVRSQGFGFDDEEVERGVRSVAAPVREASGKVIASIGVSAPSFLLPKSSINSTAQTVKDIAADLSRQLGWKTA